MVRATSPEDLQNYQIVRCTFTRCIACSLYLRLKGPLYSMLADSQIEGEGEGEGLDSVIYYILSLHFRHHEGHNSFQEEFISYRSSAFLHHNLYTNEQLFRTIIIIILLLSKHSHSFKDLTVLSRHISTARKDDIVA
jgi:hypothetical protein